MNIPTNMPRLKGFRFPRDIISYPVWAYHHFALSTANVEDLLAERGVIVSREASRRADGSLQDHYHLIRPAADSESGRTYKLFRSKAKDEAVCRLLELQFGHQLTSGPNNQFAEMRLHEQGRDWLADQLATAFGDEGKPRATFNSNDHQAARRQDFDLPALRHQLKELAKLPCNQQPQALAELIDNHGLELADAVETGLISPA